MSFFETTHQDKNSRARTGVMHTDHGDVETPCFMPVGTQASVKTLDQTDVANLGAEIILGNTYHLHLRPGEDLIAAQGGLHKFMNWPHAILTDSGGFQVLSLGVQRERSDSAGKRTSNEKLVKIDEDGVSFRSHLDGSTHRFTPESSIEIQHKLGADIIMAFDECTPDDATREYTLAAMERTHRWAERCVAEHQKNTTTHNYQQFLFGIVQGALQRDLREASAKFIAALPFDGIAIGGESIGYNMQATADILDWVYPFLPADKPHYAMGLGLSPTDLFTVVERGIDMFDCVAPTRLARHGMLYHATETQHRLNITNARFATDTGPIDEHCTCSTCQTYSRSYLHHLFAVGEVSALRLATIHNVHFFLDLMKTMRQAIRNDQFLDLKKKWTGV